MHIDQFIHQNEPTWDHLAVCIKAARRPSRMHPGQTDQLIALYQRTSAQLSYARTYFKDPALTGRLTALVAEANAVIYGQKRWSLTEITRFFRLTFPGAVYHNRRFVAVGAALLVIPAMVMLVWLTNSPDALDASAPAAEREFYVEKAFEAYYSSLPSAGFATIVGINNIQVSFLAFIGGALVIPGVFVMISNGLMLGERAAWMTVAGEGQLFWTLIAPHGLLELTSIVLAGGAGFSVGWSLVRPGDRLRGKALGDEGRRAAAMILGLIAFFVIAALIEGFVTGSDLAIEVKVGIGVIVWVLLVTYLVTQGRRAASLGVTGALGKESRPTWADETTL